MISLLLLSAALVAAGPDVAVQTLAGERIEGAVVEFSPSAIALRTAEGETNLPFDSLLNLSPVRSGTISKEPATMSVRLVDGSLLAATAYQTVGSKATVKLAGGAAIELSSKAIHWVRFVDPSQPDDKVAQQWSEIVDSKSPADMLVVRKQGAIDFLEGVLHDVDAENVKFELDKEVIPVKRFKVEGLVYYHASGESPAEPICELTDLHGTRLNVSKLSLSESAFKLATPAGLTLDLPFESLGAIDFSRGKIQFLSDMQPTLVKFIPYFGLKTDLPALNNFYRPALDIGLEQNPLKLEGKQYNKGLALHSQTLVEYRLPAKFRAFKAVVGIDDHVSDGGNALVVIKGDSKPLWSGTVRGGAPAQALDLDISGVKRLEIFVDYGDDLDVGDHVDFCDARVVK